MRTIRLPKFLPSRSPINASGAFSNLSTTFRTEVSEVGTPKGREFRTGGSAINNIVLGHGVYLV